jgi:hypothetical protein
LKRIIAIGLILLISLQCFYKVGVITYFQLNREYIAEVLCINKAKASSGCNGQCFLKKNLKLAEERAADKNAPPIGKEKAEFVVFVISESEYALRNSSQLANNDSPYLNSISSEHSSAPFHPPCVS